MFSVNSDNNTLEVLSIVGVTDVKLLDSPLLHGLHGLLAVEAHTVLLPLGPQKCDDMGLQNVDLKMKQMFKSAKQLLFLLYQYFEGQIQYLP